MISHKNDDGISQSEMMQARVAAKNIHKKELRRTRAARKCINHYDKAFAVAYKAIRNAIETDPDPNADSDHDEPWFVERARDILADLDLVMEGLADHQCNIEVT